jgi:hypothetical protein
VVLEEAEAGPCVAAEEVAEEEVASVPVAEVVHEVAASRGAVASLPEVEEVLEEGLPVGVDSRTPVHLCHVLRRFRFSMWCYSY